MPIVSLFVIVPLALTLAFVAYSWHRHVFERECLVLFREEQALVAPEARQARAAQSVQAGTGDHPVDLVGTVDAHDPKVGVRPDAARPSGVPR